ncbi:MAG: hypothetical protein RLZZ436_2097 [Planctomycetota bacterium]|jgi:hypothetical protein
MAGLFWMICWFAGCCGTIADCLLQSDGDRAAGAAQELRSEVLSWDALQEKLSGGEYRAIDRAVFEELRQRAEENSSGAPRRPWIRRAEYGAEFRDGTLSGGQLKFQLYDVAAASSAESPPLLGRTNLQQLRLVDPQGELPLGADLERRLYVLKRGVSGDVLGSFGADGVVSGAAVSFRLELPAATTSQLELTTPADIQVTGSGCLVTSQTPPGGGVGKLWRLIPADPTRLTFICRRSPGLAAQDPALLTGFGAWHSLQGDILTSRWTVGVPADLGGGSELTLRLSPGTRVLGVAMEDQRELVWESAGEADAPLLRVKLPAEGSVGSFSVQGVRVVEQLDTWKLPTLVPDGWKGAAEQRGPLLTPPGPVTVTLPTSLRVDEWTLVGMQERDVIAGPDMSQTFQLLQFEPGATAFLRTSTNSPQLAETIVHLAEVSGQTESVRSYVNLECAEAAVVEASWPVAAGWDVISVRYASSGRPLLFELLPAVEGREGGRLQVYFSETLEAGSSRVLEILFQRSNLGTVSVEPLQLPLLTADGVRRGDVYLLWGRGGGLSRGSAARWSEGRAELSLEEFRGRLAWFPEQRLSEGLRCCLPGSGGVTAGRPARDSVAGSVEHELRLVGGRIREESRISMPGWPETGVLVVQLPLEAGGERAWRVGDQEVSAESRVVEGVDGRWLEYLISRPGGAIAGPVLITVAAERELSQRFVVGVPRGGSGGWPGFLRVPGTGQMQVVAENLEKVAASAGRSEGVDEWLLPGTGEQVTVRISRRSEAPEILLREIRQYHLLQQTGTESVHEILGVVDLDASAGVERCSLQWAVTEAPQLVVNGQGVRGEVRDGELHIPLPAAGGRSRLLLLWRERTDARLGPEWPVRLTRINLAGGEAGASTGNTIHALVSLGDLQTGGGQRLLVSTEPAESLPTWRELLMGVGVVAAAGTSEADAEVSFRGAAGLRQFVSRWQLAVADGVEQQLFVVAGEDAEGVELRAALRQRSTAAAIGAGLVSFGLFLGLAGWLSRRLPWASLPVGVSCAASIVADDSVIGLVIRGSFWGSCAGMLLLLLLHGGQRVAGKLRWRRGLLVSSVLLAVPLPGVAQESAGTLGATVRGGDEVASEPLAEVLIPETKGDGSGLVFVREDVLRRLRAGVSGGEDSVGGVEATGEGLIQSVRTRVLAEAADRVELLLEIEVVAPSGGREAEVRLPLGGNRLLSCQLDGQPILPETQLGEQLVVRLPPSVEVPVRSLVDEGAEVGGVAAVADERAAFTRHLLECRLWPVLSRQSAVVQFRLPGLPCPRSTVEILAPPGLYSGARLQTSDGVFQWDPAAGEQQLNSLSTSDGADLRLLQAGLEKGVRVPASVETLVVAENTAGLQQLILICRFKNWNPLKGELRARVPAGYRLSAVTALEGLGVDELLWSLKEQQAVISLPPGHTGEFVLQLQMASLRPLPVMLQEIPVGELQQFADCIQGKTVLAAIRSGNAVAAAAVAKEQAEVVAFSAESQKWGTWLRRTDTLLRAPVDLGILEVKLDPRSSRHELRMSQSCTVRDKEVEWSCRMDVETSQSPVFRHRITVPGELRVTDVQVTAGEANRLQSWHRRGDQLTVQLREGTTGVHGIELRGRMELRPDDSRVRIGSPRLQNSQVLESLLTLTDETTVGLHLEDAGAAVPLQAGINGGQLRPGEPFRLQLISESRVVVLERLNPVEPTGRVAVLRSGEQVVLVMRLSNWSSRLGPLRMQFAPGTTFLAEPIVLTERGTLELVRNGESFESGPEQMKDLFGVSEFSVAWSANAVAGSEGGGEDRFSWPMISDQVVWTEALYNGRLDSIGGSGSGAEELPQWASAAAEALGAGLSEVSLRAGLRLAIETVLQGDKLVLPGVGTVAEGVPEGVVNGPHVHAVSQVQMQDGRATRGKTALLILARRYPVQVELEIPDSLVLEYLPAALQPLQGSEKRGRFSIELNGPVTQLELRWLSRGRGASLFSPGVRLELPHLEGAKSRTEGVLRLTTVGEGSAGIQGNQRLGVQGEAEQLITGQILRSLQTSGFSPVQLGLREDAAVESERLAGELLSTVASPAMEAGGEAWFRVDSNDSVEFVVRQRLKLERILTAGIGLLMCSAAVLFAAPARSAGQRSLETTLVRNADRGGQPSKSVS